MSDPSQDSTVLVITKDIELLSSLLEGNTTDYQFNSRESMQEALQDSGLLNNNHIVIIDIDSVPGGTAGVVEQTINLKKSDPTQVVMMIGEQEPLADILKSNIQPIIYRAFNKPINPNQVFLAFGSASKVHSGLIEKQAAGEDILSVGPAENKTNIDSIAAQHKSKTPLYAGLGVLALGLVGWLLLSNNSDTAIETTPTPITSTTTEVDSTLVTTNDDVSNINQLNQEAAKALLEGRQISPPNDNAIYYYNQVLAIDPYDLTAYEGKKAIVGELKNSFSSLVDNAEFDTALEAVNTLQEIEPLDTSHIQLRGDLETAITAYVAELKNSGTQEEIELTTEVLAKLGPQSESSKAAAAALQNEKVLLTNIDKALDANNLIPPTAGNAFAIVSQALQKNTISKVNFAPRISSLSEKLVVEANTALEEKNLEMSETYTALVKRLDVDPENTASLEAKLEDLKTAIAAEAATETATEEEDAEEVAVDDAKESEEEAVEEPVVDKIIPAKLISRSPPRYPSRAINREIEGWVDISFTIDTDGKPVDIEVLDSEPKNTFDKAAVTAVKKWRFSPAMNETTNETVTSTVDSTRLQFKLN